MYMDKYAKLQSKGCKFLDKQKFGDALEAFKEALSYKPFSRVTKFNIALCCYELNLLDEAERMVKEFLKIDDKDDEAINLYGLIFLKKNKFVDALDCFQDAVNLDPNSAVYYNHLGVAYFKLEKLNFAYRCFEKAHSLDPDNVEVKVNFNDLKGMI